MIKPRRGPRAPHPLLDDVAWLTEEYVVKRRTAENIAQELGCSRGAVTNALKRFEIKVRQGKPPRTYPELEDRDWLVEQLKTKTAKEIAEELGCHYHTVLNACRRFNIRLNSVSETRNESVRRAMREKYPNGRRGPLAGNWKGGKPYKTKAGYVLVYAPDHPRGPRVFEHILVMEKMLGRYLEPGEVVHHKPISEGGSGLKDDNRPENLALDRNGTHVSKHARKAEWLEAETARLRAENARLRASLSALSNVYDEDANDWT